MTATSIEALFQEELYHVPGAVMVILPRPWHNILEEEKALLTKILGSVRLGIGSVNIQAFEHLTVEKLFVLQPAKVLIFGCALEGGTINPYENTLIGNIPVISADDLAQLDDAKKKSLWLALKQMFSL